MQILTYHVDFPPCCFAFTHLMAAYFHDRLPTISEVFLLCAEMMRTR